VLQQTFSLLPRQHFLFLEHLVKKKNQLYFI